MFWRGDQIRKGIESYYKGIEGHPAKVFPVKLDDLVKDPRKLQTVRHLRKVYKDPMTGEDFALIKEGGKIKGVKSTSTKTPFRQGNFPEGYDSFEGVTSYDKWEFVFTPASPKKENTPVDEAGPDGEGSRAGT